MTKNNFSEKLKELRLKNKYTQKFVAEFLGLTQRQYQYCEQGHIPSQFDVVIKMCAMYDIDANELFGIKKKNEYPTELQMHEVMELACRDMAKTFDNADTSYQLNIKAIDNENKDSDT